MLRYQDIAVLLRLSLRGEVGISFQSLASELGLSTSEVYHSVRRAEAAKLLFVDRNERPHQKVVQNSALLEFLAHGLRYAFPENGRPLLRSEPSIAARDPTFYQLLRNVEYLRSPELGQRRRAEQALRHALAPSRSSGGTPKPSKTKRRAKMQERERLRAKSPRERILQALRLGRRAQAFMALSRGQ